MGARISRQYLAQLLLRERIKLLHPNERDILWQRLGRLFLAVPNEVVIDLAAAEEYAADVRGVGMRIIENLVKLPGRHIDNVRFRVGMPQQALWRHDDERLA